MKDRVTSSNQSKESNSSPCLSALCSSRDLLTIHMHNLDTLPLQLRDDFSPQIGIHSPRALFNDYSPKPLVRGIDCRSLNAIIKRQPHDIHMRNVLLFQQRRQPTITYARILQRIIEGRIHLDLLPLPLLQHFVYLLHVQLGYEFRARRVLDAVVGPEARLVSLFGVVGVYDGGEVDKGIFGGVVRCERSVICGVPIFCSNSDCEGKGEQLINGRNDITSTRDC